MWRSAAEPTVSATVTARGRSPRAVCGEVASDPAAAPLLLGLGVDELSVAPYAVPVVKQTVRAVDLVECRDLAGRALALPDPDAVRHLT